VVLYGAVIARMEEDLTVLISWDDLINHPLRTHFRKIGYSVRNHATWCGALPILCQNISNDRIENRCEVPSNESKFGRK
jgi:hypothetical protein